MGSKVEEHYLAKSGRKLCYAPTEKISVIQVDNFPDLGKLSALRFLEWVIENPEGVISLPTGKTPEYFIKQVNRFLTDWQSEKVRAELEEVGISHAETPDMSGLHFVQIDEFYPMNPAHRNSFYNYVSKYYIERFGLDPNKSLLLNTFDIPTSDSLPLNEIFPDDVVDLSLRTDYAKTKLEKLQKDSIELVDQFCTEYEAKIRELGGIGFFLGGIGPDGHIGFNVRGSDHFSVTRLTPTNYETQAAAATDLGGIEVSSRRLVITIGLETLTYKKDCVAIIIAAGEAKANIVAKSIESEKSNYYPATALQILPEARFYITEGAAARLNERKTEDIQKSGDLTNETIERHVSDNGSTRGIAIDNDGNILYSSFATLYKIDYKTGAGLGKYVSPGSITDAAVDANGLVYLGRVGSGNPLVILNSGLDFVANAVDTIPWLSRSLEVTADGKDIYYGTVWNAIGIVHFNSSLPGVLKYDIIDTLGNFTDVPDTEGDSTITNVAVWASSVDWGPDGNLWLGLIKSAFGSLGDYGSKWFVYDVANDVYVDTVGISLGDSSAGGFLAPRGATWSADGLTMYLADFDYIIIARYTRNPIGVSDERKSLPMNFSLKQNYPNPFNPVTTIPFDIQESGNVKLVVYDLVGRQVMVLYDEWLLAGSHSKDFYAGSLASGVYIYRLTVNGSEISKKMMFLK
ncbi:MAG: T9SS type A sorting domain-containing protein [Candidatus Marinimicrobia bacterium]|nr:T9SS type A sorting domain-containing protein [Candidatus Neomarinimicrobiota bacterium]